MSTLRRALRFPPLCYRALAAAGARCRNVVHHSHQAPCTPVARVSRRALSTQSQAYDRGLAPMSHQSTVYALSTSAAKAAIAIVRISGARALDVVSQLTGGVAVQGKNGAPLRPRHLHFRRLFDPVTRQQLDNGMVVWFPGPHSYTGEDIVELHLHGGRAVVNAVLLALSRMEVRWAV